MSAPLREWLEDLQEHPGVLACAIRLPDRSTAVRSWSSEYSREILEQVARQITDTREVLQVSSLPNPRQRWMFEKGVIYSEIREDGTCLCLATTHQPWLGEGEMIMDLLDGFRNVR